MQFAEIIFLHGGFLPGMAGFPKKGGSGFPSGCPQDQSYKHIILKSFYRVSTASKKKKGRKNDTLEKLVLATAILSLIKALIDLINNLTG